MHYVALLFLYFIGLGSYLAGLSPYVLQNFEEDAYLIFLTAEGAYPVGYFLIGWLSDRYRRIRGFLVAGLILIAPVQFLLYSLPESAALTIIFSALTRLLLSANVQLISIAILEDVGSGPYSRIRAAGTTGFLFFQLAMWILTDPFFFGSFLAANNEALLPGFSPGDGGRIGSLAYLACVPFALAVASHRKSHDEYRLLDAVRFFSHSARALAFLGLSFTFFFCFQVVDNYLGRFWELRGGTGLVYSGWLVAVLLEIPFLVFTERIARGLGVRWLFYCAAGAAAGRFGLLTFSILGHEPVPVLFSQLLHGVHFAGYYIGAIYWLKASCPDHLYGSVYGIYHVAAHSLGGMIGNVFFGTLLFTQLGPELLQWWAPQAAATDTVAFLPVFAGATLLNVLVIFGFMMLGEPRTKSRSS